MKYILDLDTGIDDTFALLYLLANKKEVLGVCTTLGNVTSKEASDNTLRILDSFNYDLPVYKGEDKTYKSNKTYIPDKIAYLIHGKNGIANASFKKSKRKVESIKASDYIVSTANKYGKDLTLICTGALTNLANAIDKDYKAIKKISKIVIMGGALSVEGNVNKYVEANIHNDIKAAKRVFESGINITMVGLDVTMKTMLKEEDFNIWNTNNNSNAKNLYKMLKYYCRYKVNNNLYAALHDPLAVEVAINPSIVKYALPINIKVDDNGKTIGDLNKINDSKIDEVILEVNSKRFIRKFIKKINEELKKYD